jgi:hypothetical protein
VGNSTRAAGQGKTGLAKANRPPVKGQVVSPQLRELEATIKRGPHSYLESGRALAKVRDGDLHHEAGYRSFEHYCKERLYMSKAHVSRLIVAARRVDQLGEAVPMGTVLDLIQNERQAREIGSKVASIRQSIEQGEAPEAAVRTALDDAVEQRRVRRHTVTSPSGPNGYQSKPYASVDDLPGQVIRRDLERFIYRRFRQLDMDEAMEIATEVNEKLTVLIRGMEEAS